jgi:cytochrome c oxidase subunit 1
VSAIFSTDHKVIGKQFLFLGLLMALVGAFTAYLIRWQIAHPNVPAPLFGVVQYGTYNMLVTMHGTIMVFYVAMPILLGSLSNFLIPLQIGARDMAFPKLNMLSFWVMVLSSVVLLASFFLPGGAAAAGWTGYPPLSADPRYTGVPWGVPAWLLALALAFASSTMGGINYIATVITQRAKGMTALRIPLTTWCLLSATVIFFFSVGPLVAGAVMLLLDCLAGTGFYLPERGGEPLLWQHLFWFFGHPEVYVVLLPALGAVLEILPVFTRRPVFGYRTILVCLGVATVLSYLVWAHHMFVSGMNFKLAMPFSLLTILISVPFSAIYFCMFASLRKSAIRFEVPMLWALGFLSTFLIGGLTGIFLGAASSDIFFQNTYFVVAHFHYTLFPSTFFGGFAAITFWFPKMFGRKLNARLGQLHFWLTFLFFNSVFWPMFRVGAVGMPRRIADVSQYSFLNGVAGLNHFITVAAICLILSQAVFFVNFFYSIFKGPKAEANPWEAATLEWSAASPPPHGNWGPSAPVVVAGPYEYSQPGAPADWMPQAAVEEPKIQKQVQVKQAIPA